MTVKLEESSMQMTHWNLLSLTSFFGFWGTSDTGTSSVLARSITWKSSPNMSSSDLRISVSFLFRVVELLSVCAGGLWPPERLAPAVPVPCLAGISKLSEDGRIWVSSDGSFLTPLPLGGPSVIVLGRVAETLCHGDDTGAAFAVVLCSRVFSPNMDGLE